MKPKIYLAGPEVFYSDPHGEADKLKKICDTHGLEGCFPLDANYPPEDGSITQAERIYIGDVRLIDVCDAVIANMMPFRGVSMDVGTAFEIGYAIAQGKPVFGWSIAHNDNYANRVSESKLDDGMQVEGYDLVDNLMVVIPLHEKKVHASFEEAAKAASSVLT